MYLSSWFIFTSLTRWQVSFLRPLWWKLARAGHCWTGQCGNWTGLGSSKYKVRPLSGFLHRRENTIKRFVLKLCFAHKCLFSGIQCYEICSARYLDSGSRSSWQRAQRVATWWVWNAMLFHLLLKGQYLRKGRPNIKKIDFQGGHWQGPASTRYSTRTSVYW